MRIVLTLLLISLSLPAGAGKAPDTVREYRIFTAVCADKKSGKYFFALRRYVA